MEGKDDMISKQSLQSTNKSVACWLTRIDHWMKRILTKSVGLPFRDVAVRIGRKEMEETEPDLMTGTESYFDQLGGCHVGGYDLLLHEGTWKQFQHLDSTIVLRILKRLLDKNIIDLPIHDSFIDRPLVFVEVEETMTMASRAVFPNLIPILKL